MTDNTLPPIPAKKYFTIGETSKLCSVKPHVLRYWEQEFDQLSPVKRRGNRRYYQHQDIQTIRQIRTLLYEQGFTISGAKQKLAADRTTPNADKQAPSLLDSIDQKQLLGELEMIYKLLK
ncbi:MAG: MerR family transcriptional regulator [Gammaproteobacteria bacterium]|nr:MAG: MerR family transcriptional regulator [Gammaproteobacteria bacterium]